MNERRTTIPEPSRELYDAVLNKTISALRRRKYRPRRIAIACALALAYGAGMLTLTLWQPRPGTETIGLNRRATAGEPANELRAASAEKKVYPIELLYDSEALARRINRTAGDDRVRLLEWAGDTYLETYGDVRRAVRCYSELLDTLPAENSIDVEPDDSWLLIEMKRARRMEVKYDVENTNT